MVSRIVRILDSLSRLLMVLAGVMIVLMAAHVVLDVARRYILNAPLKGTIEIVSYFYMLAVVFLPLSVVERTNGHFVSGLFTDNLPAPTLRRLEGVTSLLMALVAGMLAWCAVSGALHATATGERVLAADLIIYTWPARWLVPASLWLMTAQALIAGISRLFLPPATPRALPGRSGNIEGAGAPHV